MNCTSSGCTDCWWDKKARHELDRQRGPQGDPPEGTCRFYEVSDSLVKRDLRMIHRKMPCREEKKRFPLACPPCLSPLKLMPVARYLQAGLVYSEKGSLSEVLCKPKLMPIKSTTLVAMEEKEREIMALASGAPPGTAV